MNPAHLHAAYVRLTGLEIAWSMARIYTWEVWLAFREPKFGIPDIEMVVKHLKRGIKDGTRNVGALKFSNLIGNPERFEEDLAEARAVARNLQPARTERDSVLEASGRPIVRLFEPARTSGDVLAASKAFEEFQKMKGNL